jgi:hypothetical protein
MLNMSRQGRFGVGQICTAGFLPYLAASVASLREHNSTVPVTVSVDEVFPGLNRISESLAVDVRRVDVDTTGLYAASPAELESTRSRIVKIRSLIDTEYDVHYYVDSDTVALGDIADIMRELGDRVGTEADLFMLLNRPVAPTFWGDRHLYLIDPDVTRAQAAEVVGTAYGLSLPERFIDELVCWNSGVILGTAPALRMLGERWLTLYRRMLAAPNRAHIIPRDQLGFWLALWELRDRLRVAELPRRWNFMAGHLLGIEPGTEEVDETGWQDARVLHLAQNKDDPWARRLVADALGRIGLEALAPSGANTATTSVTPP